MTAAPFPLDTRCLTPFSCFRFGCFFHLRRAFLRVLELFSQQCFFFLRAIELTLKVSYLRLQVGALRIPSGSCGGAGNGWSRVHFGSRRTLAQGRNFLLAGI